MKPTKPTTGITEKNVNTYIKENPDILTHYSRNEGVMETRKQINARSSLNNAFEHIYIYIMFLLYIYIVSKHGE